MRLELRPALPGDAPTLARIHRDARDTIPLTNALHSFEETAAHYAGLIAAADVRCAEIDGRIVGHAARQGEVLAQLYVDPAHHRSGVGARLLAAMRRESALTLWCFAHNHRALAFYKRFGAVEIAREDGDANEEGLPAIQLALTRLA